MRDDPNLPYLKLVAVALGDLREQLVFVGGAVAGMLLTDPLASGIRSTKDVDVVADAGIGPFQRIEHEFAALGFARDANADVTCRWTHRGSGIPVDLMPVDPRVLGFSNRWYRYAIDTAQTVALAPGLAIRMATAVAFVAMKLEAFADRGARDLLASHDLEDVLNLVDGREELSQELDAAPQPVREAVAAAITRLLRNPDFINGLPGMITEPERVGVVLERLARMAG